MSAAPRRGGGAAGARGLSVAAEARGYCETVEQTSDIIRRLPALGSPERVRAELAGGGYLADEALATAVFLAAALEQPLLLEGEPGTGKTSVATALAERTGARLIRLQCHEGIDVADALYDWDVPAQLLAARTAEPGSPPPDLHDERFLIRRPLLEALTASEPVVLLLDEVDRADEAFEAFLLELLGDFQVTIPALGTVRAARRPLVVLTSNRTRELHDALKRRCVYHWIDYPGPEREAAIVAARLPGIDAAIAERVARAVALLRRRDLYKPPGIGEAVAWARALLALGSDADLEATLGVALKVREDVERVRTEGMLAQVAP